MQIEITSTKHVDQWLEHYGYDSIEQVQEFYGLTVDGYIGPQTIAALNRPRCGVQDFGIAADCTWEKKKLKYWNGRGGFSLFHKEMPKPQSQQVSAHMIDAGFSRWAEVLPGFTFERTSSAEEADIWIGGGSGRNLGFDGPGQTLAWAYLPCGPDERLESRFDMAELWTNNPAKRNKGQWIYAWSVWLHELGHLLGLDHSKNKNDIMAPYYNPDIVDLQPGDITRIQTLYNVGTE